MRKLRLPTKVCAHCGKGAVIGYNRPHSLHKTKRVVKPNLQYFRNPIGVSAVGARTLMCTRCMRTLTKKSR